MKTFKIIGKMKPALLLICLSTAIAAASAQQPAKQTMPSARDVVVGVKPVETMTLMEHSGGVATKTELSGTPGDAFLDPNWQPGLAVMEDGALIEIQHLRYNLLTQQMQFIRDSETLAIANPDEIKMIRIADKVFVFESFICKGVLSKGYLELIEDGNCRLFRRWTATYRHIDQVTGIETIYRTQTCLLQFGEEIPREVSSNSKVFLDKFGEHSQAIRRLMKNEKLKIRNTEDLRTIVAHYNRIAEKGH